MKRHAQLGEWKTPPNLVYAQEISDAGMPPVAPAMATSTAAAGTKMQLMGLNAQKRDTPQQRTMAPPLYQQHSDFSSYQQRGFGDDLRHVPNSSPISFSESDALQHKKPVKKGTSNVTSAATLSHAGSKSFTSPEEKEKMLAHSRTMARLRRQQQRVLTDSLESEYYELCVSAAYLKAALKSTPCNRPLHSTQIDHIYQQAIDHSFEAMSSNMPTGRSQELKAHNGRSNLPQAHYVPSLRLDEATAAHLAVTVGSRRESLSFSTERRKGALAWSTEGVKNVFSDLALDAVPLMLTANCALNNGVKDELASRLKLTPEQKEKILQIMPETRTELVRILAAQRAATMVLSENWLSLPKTEALMEHVRDTTTTEQMNKLISWSITNESQISALRLGAVPSAPTSPVPQ